MGRHRLMTKGMLRRERAGVIKARKQSDKIWAQMAPPPTFEAFVGDAAKNAQTFSRKSQWSKIVKFRHDLSIEGCDRMVSSLKKLVKDAETTISKLQSK